MIVNGVSFSIRIIVVTVIIIFAFTSIPIVRSSSMIMPSSLSRIAVVTGANKGIGYHIALQLASCGLFHTVILACRDPSLGQTAVDTMKQQLSNNCNTNVVYMPLTIGNVKSHQEFQNVIKNQFGGMIDVLVNNAAIAFKNADPTPFRDQCKPTLDINFRGTVDFTERMIPFLLKKRDNHDARIVNVASMAGRLDQIRSPQLREQFQSPTLTMEELHTLVNQFEHDVVVVGGNDDHLSKGWGNSNYGFSKLALIAATKVWARDHHPTIKVNCCCPGYCDTDMTSHKGPRPPSEGAKNAVLPAIINIEDCPTGQYIANQQIASW